MDCNEALSVLYYYYTTTTYCTWARVLQPFSPALLVIWVWAGLELTGPKKRFSLFTVYMIYDVRCWTTPRHKCSSNGTVLGA